MFLHPVKYWRRWMNTYKQWEFWALAIVTIGTYEILLAQHHLPGFLQNSEGNAKALITAIIMMSMPYLMRRKEIRLKGREDWFMHLLSWFTRPGKLLGRLAAALLVLSAVSFCFPIFTAQQANRAISGLELSLHHPLAAMVPVFYLLTAALLLRNFREWRILSLFWILGCYTGTFAVAGLYTNMDADVPGNFGWLALLCMGLPPIALILCLIPQKKTQAKSA